MTFVYTPPTKAGVGVLPGTRLLLAELRAAFPMCTFGSYNRRCVAQCGKTVPVGAARCPNGHGISHHAESTAVDVMTGDPAIHAVVISWALTAGRAWEVQEIVTGFPPASTGITGPARWVVGQGWKPYDGPSAHTDHVHLSQTLTAAMRTTPPIAAPPIVPQEDDTMFRLIRPAGFYDIALLGGVVVVDGLTPDIVNDLVDANLVVGVVPGGRNYDAAASVLRVDTWTALCGRGPIGPRPAGEV